MCVLDGVCDCMGEALDLLEEEIIIINGVPRGRRGPGEMSGK
jgi:hypothetical protein